MKQSSTMLEQINFTTKSILDKTNQFRPEVGIILGTGLGGLVKEINTAVSYTHLDVYKRQHLCDWPVGRRRDEQHPDGRVPAGV